MTVASRTPTGHADLLRQRFYCYGVRIPRWLFVLIYGEPRIKLPGDKENG